MKIYIGSHGNSNHLKMMEKHERLGAMCTPSDYRMSRTCKHALDNGAFTAYINGTCFDDMAFLQALKHISSPDFVVLPDIVAGGKKSLEYSMIWRDFLPSSFNWYLAVQDGMNAIPESLIERVCGLFVGGSMRWKMATAEAWIDYGHKRGLKVHIGRIGTLKGIMWADRIGADSIDSSNFAQHEKNWKELLEWLDGKHQPLEALIEI